MKSFGVQLFLLSQFILLSYTGKAQNFTFLSPKPESKYINPHSSIIIKCSEPVDQKALKEENFQVVGSISGNHTLNIKWIGEHKILIISPCAIFENSEIIQFHYNGMMKAVSGINFPVVEYQFSTSLPVVYYHDELVGKDNQGDEDNNELGMNDKALLMTVLVNNNPAPGRIFFSNISNLNPANRSYAIVENDASPVLYVEDPKLGMGFTLQKNGYLSCYSRNDSAFIIFDSVYQAIDTFQCANGYKADQHEFQLLENNHALMLAYDAQIIDMSVIVPGGASNAIVTGSIIQELDENKNVIFQWRSWDHFQITDAEHQILTSNTIDYCHINSIEKDTDSNYIISSRNMDEITKIDHNSGDIIWRMGGKNNEFTFINDTAGFCSQHDARRIANGHLTLFDNGNYHVPQESSAKEYELDEVNKIATLIWSYRHPDPIYGRAMGNVQRLPNGNTVIGWGWCLNTDPFITEITPDSMIVYEASLDHLGDFTYRAFRFEWYPSSNSVFQNQFAEGIRIFPNPADYKIKLLFGESKELEPAQLQITDITGRVVFQKQVTGEEVIDVSDLKPALYFISLVTSAKVLSSRLMIVR